MKRLVLSILMIWSFGETIAQTTVAPNIYASSAASSTFLGPLNSGVRTYQLLINQNQLTGMVGQEITGIAWRINGTTAWPAATTTYATYEVYVGPGVAPASRDLTSVANNRVGTQILGRGGSLVINAGDYGVGGPPNPFGPAITFTTPYLYTGGHLLVEVRHSASDGTNRSTESASTSASGYGTDYSACYASSITAPASGTGGNFSVIQLSHQQPLDVSLTFFDAAWKNNAGVLTWTTVSEKDASHFVVERSFDGESFEEAGQVKATGNSSTERNYSFTDKADGLAQVKKVYYRIKMQDLNGSYTYSRVALITPAMVTVNVADIYPNPVEKTLNIKLNLGTDQDMNYEITNIQGQQIMTDIYKYKAGAGSIGLDVQQLPAGNYLILLKSDNLQQTVPFVKR